MLQVFRKHPVRSAAVTSVLTGISGQGALLVTGVLAARILGVEDRGYLGLLVVFPTLCSQILALGFPQAITFQTASNPNQLPIILKFAKKMFVIQALAIMVVHGIIVWVYLFTTPHLQHSSVYLTILVGPALLAIQYGFAFLQGIGEFSGLIFLRLFWPILYAIMIAGLFSLDAGDLSRITIVWVISTVMAGLLAIELIRRLKNSMRGMPTPEQQLSPKEMLKFGLKGLVGSTFPMETFRLDQLVAGLILSPSALGLYVVGQAFGTLSRLVAQSAALVAYPTVVSRQGGHAGQKTLWRFFWAVTLVNGLITVSLVFLVPMLIPLLFGEQFVEAIPLAQILLIGSALAASRLVLVEGLRGLSQPQASTIAEISMYPWFLTGGVFLLWNYGVQGLASGVAFGFFISLVVALWFAWGQKRGALTFSQRSKVGNSLS